MIIVNDFQPLTIITKRPILDVEAVLDLPVLFCLDSILLEISLKLRLPFTNIKSDVNITISIHQEVC